MEAPPTLKTEAAIATAQGAAAYEHNWEVTLSAEEKAKIVDESEAWKDAARMPALMEEYTATFNAADVN